MLQKFLKKGIRLQKHNKTKVKKTVINLKYIFLDHKKT